MHIPDPLYAEILRSMPIPCVDLLVTDDSRRVLMLKRVHFPAQGQWWLPGGRVHYFEPRPEAARRKLREECGLEAAAVEEWGTYDLIFPHASGGTGSHAISTVYHCSVRETSVRVDGQSDTWQWRSASEWSREVDHPMLRLVLDRWASGGR